MIDCKKRVAPKIQSPLRGKYKLSYDQLEAGESWGVLGLEWPSELGILRYGLLVAHGFAWYSKWNIEDNDARILGAGHG